MYKKNLALTTFLIVFYGLMIIFPIIVLCTNIEPGTLAELLQSNQFRSALYNSLIVSSISTFISLLIAYVLAFTINRTNIRHKSFLVVLFTLSVT